MTRTYEKKSALGIIRKEMRFSSNNISIYTMVNGIESYSGTIEKDMECALSLEWKENGFSEMQ